MMLFWQASQVSKKPSEKLHPAARNAPAPQLLVERVSVWCEKTHIPI